MTKTVKQGELNIGLTYYQELQWLSAIKRYGNGILNKSLLSEEQKKILTESTKAETMT